MGNNVRIIDITHRVWYTDLISSDCMINNIRSFPVLVVAMHAKLMKNLSDKSAILRRLKSLACPWCHDNPIRIQKDPEST